MTEMKEAPNVAIAAVDRLVARHGDEQERPRLTDPPSPKDEALRRALLQRIADRLAYARAAAEGSIVLDGSCCWVSYEYLKPPLYIRGEYYPARMEHWSHSLCTRPGITFSEYLKTQCPHWHHQTEVFYA